MRPSASIVLTPSGPAGHLQACLESLRPTLGVRDQVLVVDTGTDAATSARLRSTSWATVVEAPAGANRAAQRNLALRSATHDVVVLLDGDTLVTAHWLDGLLAPLADEVVAASGPRTNYARGLQSLEVVPYEQGRSGGVSRLARERRQDWRRRTTQTPLLEGFALALRRTDLEHAGGLDDRFDAGHDVTDLCLRLTGGGRHLLVCEDVLVHRAGWAEDGGEPDWLARRRSGRQLLVSEHGARAEVVPATPLLSACMIVKDEAERLPACLASLDGLVDEIVVYDTGSSDDTVAIARAAGALVLEGYWDDDFGRARNDSLAACSGEWVLHIDADEVVEGPLPDIRRDLETRQGQDVLHVRIDNLDDDGNIARSHEAGRVFRRLRAHWHGHLHEQLVPRSGEALRPPLTPTPLTLRHAGYISELVASRRKRDRNLRVAQSGVEAQGGTDPRSLVNLGRSLAGAGQHAEALEVFRRVRSLTREPVHLRYALRYGAEILISDGRGSEALLWIDALRRETASTTVPDYLAGLAHLQLGDPAAALALFEGLEELADEMSTLPAHVLLSRRGLTYVAAGRFAEAVDELRVALRETRAWAPLWGPLVVSCWNSRRSLDEAVGVVTDEDLLTVLGHSMGLVPEVADSLAEALWARWAADPRLLAYASRIAGRLPLPRALEWAARLRAAGLEDCPLLALAGDTGRDPVERLQAAAAALEAFADERGRSVLRTAAGDVEPARFVEALTVVDELSPRLLGAVVLGAATTPDRASAMADVLRALGAEEQADALLLASA